MRCKFIAWAAVALIGVASVSAARADVLFDNLSYFSTSGTYSSDPIKSATNGGGGPDALSFSTGAQGVALSSVELALQGSSDAGGINVSLWSNNPTGSSTSTPAPKTQISLLGTILDSALPTSFNVVSLNLSTLIALDPNTRYWIELSDANLNSTVTSALWAYQVPAAGTGVTGEYDWNNYSGNLNSTALNSSFGVDFMAVDAVPEPASFGLLAFGLAGLMLVRRRRTV
jgi:hypothetical protein